MLTHGFGPKMAIFQTFFLGYINQENMFYDILEKRKNAFLGYKKKELQKVQKWPFFQLFFRQYTLGKCVLRYSRTKKRLSNL